MKLLFFIMHTDTTNPDRLKHPAPFQKIVKDILHGDSLTNIKIIARFQEDEAKPVCLSMQKN